MVGWHGTALACRVEVADSWALAAKSRHHDADIPESTLTTVSLLSTVTGPVERAMLGVNGGQDLGMPDP